MVDIQLHQYLKKSMTMPVKQAMLLSRANYIVNNLMVTRRVNRAGYPVSGHNIVTGYIMGLNPDGTCSVRLTHPRRMVAIT